MHSENHQLPPQPPFWRSRYAIGLVVIGGIAAYFLLEEHRAHMLGALPYLFLLACPLMHLFMHHGHGGHSHHQHRNPSDSAGQSNISHPEDRP